MPYDVVSITLWSTLPRTAEYFQSSQFPHALVVGDAAHAFPPTGGLGVNTGIADAQNLAWKIHAVEKSWADESILGTYGSERRPVAVANARQSVRNQMKLRNLKAALRNPPEQLAAATESRFPEWRQKLDHEMRENSEHFDSINLQIGYIYGAEAGSEGPCDIYRAKSVPGIRLPHTWVMCAKGKISVLELIDGHSFVLFESERSSDGLFQGLISKSSIVPIRVIRVGREFEVLDHAWLDIVGLSKPDSGLLIRPDQHVLGNVTSASDLQGLLAACLRPVPHGETCGDLNETRTLNGGEA